MMKYETISIRTDAMPRGWGLLPHDAADGRAEFLLIAPAGEAGVGAVFAAVLEQLLAGRPAALLARSTAAEAQNAVRALGGECRTLRQEGGIALIASFDRLPAAGQLAELFDRTDCALRFAAHSTAVPGIRATASLLVGDAPAALEISCMALDGRAVLALSFDPETVDVDGALEAVRTAAIRAGARIG